MIYNMHWNILLIYDKISTLFFPSNDPRRKFSGLSTGMQGAAAKKIIESKNDSFVFIVIPLQDALFNKFLEKYDLKKYVTLDTPYLTNPIHPGSRRLRLVILQSKQP